MKKERSYPQVVLKLIGLIKPLSGYMFLAILMGVVGFLCAIFITIFGGFAILSAMGISQVSLKALFISVCIFAVLRGFLRYAEQACNHYIAFKLLALIRDKLFKALRRLSPAKLEVRDRGNLISLITSDVELLEVFYAHTISPIAIAIIVSVIMIIFIGQYSIFMAMLAIIAYITVGIVIPYIISKHIAQKGREFRKNSGKLSSFVLDSLRGLSETIQYNQGENRRNQLNSRTEGLIEIQSKMSKLTGKNQAVTNSVVLGFGISMLALSSLLYSKGIIGFDGVIVGTIAMLSSFGPVIAVANLGSTLQNTFAAGNRVLDILEEEPVVTDVTGMNETKFDGAECKDIGFSYSDEEILKGLSLAVEKGKITGINGKSGSGKSTLLKLLMRFWNVQKGKVLISNKSIDEINTSDLRKMESLVAQDTHLFNDTIANNLRIAKPDASEDEIYLACKKASIHDFILSLPKGYDTNLGELGDTLSGGEKQRISLARAFLHDSPFMLLDEPTSNLDSLNEAIILKSLYEEKQDKTVMLVSHRKSTMRIADKVYSVENGRIS